jgi:hypothetical protein
MLSAEGFDCGSKPEISSLPFALAAFPIIRRNEKKMDMAARVEDFT